MSNQEKKEYLLRYRTNEQRIVRLMEELARWESRSRKVTAEWGYLPGGCGTSNPVQTAVEKIVELRHMINADIDKGIQLREEILYAIDTVMDERLRLLLCYRYIDGLTWEQIAVRMNYSYMQVCRLHGKALDVMECYS